MTASPLPPFADGPDAKVFRFRYGGAARPLHAYLLERYAHGRPEAWRESFYPERVRLDGQAVDAATVVTPGAEIAYLHLRADEPPTPQPPPLYEDDWLLAIEKAPDAPVSPGGVFYFGALAVCTREVFGNPELTPLHRLDLETSGPLLLAKRRADVATFHALFREQTLHKRYLALVHGALGADLREVRGFIVPDETSPIETLLRLSDTPPSDTQGGKGSRRLMPPEPSHTLLGERHTHDTPHGPLTEVALEPVTGKTNQLRVHMAHLGHPIVGDKKYYPDPVVFLDWYAHRDYARLADRLLLPRQALHCAALRFTHPFTGAEVCIAARPGQWAERLAHDNTPLVEPVLG